MAARDRVVVDIVTNLGRSLQGLAQLVGMTVLLRKGFDALKNSIKFAAELEKANVTFKVLLQNASVARDVMNDIVAFSAKTPFQLPELQKAAQVLLAFGVSAEDLIVTLTKLGNLSQGDSEKLDRVTEAYGKLLAKGKASMRELIQFTSAGIPIVQALADHFGVTTAEVYKLVETGKVGFKDVDAAVNTLTRDGGKFARILSEQSQTLIGLFSTLKDNINLAGAAIVEGLMPGLKEALELSIQFAKSVTHVVERTKAVSAAFGEFDLGALTDKKTDEQLLMVNERMEDIAGAMQAVQNVIGRRRENPFSRIFELGDTRTRSAEKLLNYLAEWEKELRTLEPLHGTLTRAVNALTDAQNDLNESIEESIGKNTVKYAEFINDTAALAAHAKAPLFAESILGNLDKLEFITDAYGKMSVSLSSVQINTDRAREAQMELIRSVLPDAIEKFGIHSKQVETLVVMYKNYSDAMSVAESNAEIYNKQLGLLVENTENAAVAQQRLMESMEDLESIASSGYVAMGEAFGAMVAGQEGAMQSLKDAFKNTLADMLLALAKTAAVEAAFALGEFLMFGNPTWLAAAGKHAATAAAAAAGAGFIRALGDGGIVMKPQLALVGERGPEAVIPLRGGPGAMGLGGGPSVNITNVNTTNVHGNVMYDDILRSKIRGEMAMQGRRY